MTDDELAACLATKAGALLLDLQRSSAFSNDGLGKEGDRIANAYLCHALRSERPADALLSEEETDCQSRCSVDRVWIVDPLDGTREYNEKRYDWAVHVALAIGGVAAHGAVAVPGLGVTFSTSSPPPVQPANSPLRMVVSRSRPSQMAVMVSDALGAELVPMGSAGAKAMAVVSGNADIYLHTGGQFEWDNCAPVAVAQAAGLHCSRIDGSPMRYNRSDPYLPDLLICRPELASRILRLLS